MDSLRKIASFFIIFTIIFTSINSTYAYNLNISSPSAILIESETGKILYEKNVNDVRAIASTTKIMTYLLVMEAVEEEKIKFDDKVKISKNAFTTPM